mgnify:CR=1 FL=1
MFARKELKFMVKINKSVLTLSLLGGGQIIQLFV